MAGVTREEFMRAIALKKNELKEKRDDFEQELISSLAPVLQFVKLDQEENLVFKVMTISTPFKGMSSSEIKDQLDTLPWVVSADWSGKYSYVTVREIPETYTSTIKPVIGFHS